MKRLILSLVILLPGLSSAQSPDSDSAYYDAWVGQWYRVTDGRRSDTVSFIVKRALYHSSFEEYWFGAGGIDFSKAWRAWDSRTRRWDLAWMSRDGLFQTWEGRKVDGVWYIYKTFIIDGRPILSRQAFVLKNDTTMVRTSEHSTDDGRSWTLRFREVYRKE